MPMQCKEQKLLRISFSDCCTAPSKHACLPQRTGLGQKNRGSCTTKLCSRFVSTHAAAGHTTCYKQGPCQYNTFTRATAACCLDRRAPRRSLELALSPEEPRRLAVFLRIRSRPRLSNYRLELEEN